ncbi:MAG TPA: SOS response-associated peptidase family protein [Puia sp.]|jgi:putative SOS response-associated peptidase YedK|nr:SOS response-associated peptidase family protein [Puia sp.]
MCLDISFYNMLPLLKQEFPDIVDDSGKDLDPATGMHFMALGHSRYPIIIFENGNYHRKDFEWGIIAEYMDTPEKIKAMRRSMVNARSEKILDDKRSFWHRIRRTRCLIPVTGIYEHREIKGWKNKIPYHIELKDRPMFCIPGLYHYNTKTPSDPETGEMRGMFTLITRAANPVMRQIHNSGDNAFRMPLFLPKEMELEWLRPGLSDEEIGRILSYELPADQLIYEPVFSIRGRSPRPDGKPKYAPFSYEGLPPLGNDEGQIQKALF